MNNRKYKKTSVSRYRMMPFKMMHHEKDLMMLTIQELLWIQGLIRDVIDAVREMSVTVLQEISMGTSIL